jgi:hypothetical protein
MNPAILRDAHRALGVQTNAPALLSSGSSLATTRNQTGALDRPYEFSRGRLDDTVLEDVHPLLRRHPSGTSTFTAGRGSKTRSRAAASAATPLVRSPDPTVSAATEQLVGSCGGVVKAFNGT